MHVEIITANKELASVTHDNKKVVGNIRYSPQNKYSIIYGRSTDIYNIALLTGKSKCEFIKAHHPIDAAVSDEGVFVLLRIENDETFAKCLEFYNSLGKKIKKLKTYAARLAISPNSKYLITQNMNVRDDDETNENESLTMYIYDLTNYKKVAKIKNNNFAFAEFDFSKDGKKLILKNKNSDVIGFSYAEINLDI